MRLLISIVLVLSLLAGLGSYAHWSQQRPSAHYLSDLRSQVALDAGQPGPRGNLLGIQPELFASDYQSLDRLRLKLAAYLDQADERGLLNERTVVVLPEHIGTWLLAVGEKQELYQARDQRQALHWLAASNPLEFLGAWFSARGESRLDDALLRTKAQAMARDYQSLFGGLARDYGITLVAGSIVLPEPRVELGKLQTASGPLYNVSLVFDRAGNPVGQPQRQMQPGPWQAHAIAPAAAALQVVETPAGRLAVLLGEDIYPPAELARQQVELLALPGSQRTPGADSEAADARLAARLGDNSIRAGMAVHLRGRLWEHGGQPRGQAFDSDQRLLGSAEPGAQLLNLWL